MLIPYWRCWFKVYVLFSMVSDLIYFSPNLFILVTSTLEVFISIFRTFFTLCDLLVFTLSTYDFFSILVALFFNEFLYCFGRSFNTSIIMPSPNFGSLTFYSWEIFYVVFNYSFFTTSFGTSFYIFVANLFLMIVPRLALLDLNNI